MTHPPSRGRHKVFLGMAAGVGKTYAMLEEGHEYREDGDDVVVGVVETHGRAATAARAAGLEVLAAPDGRVPRRRDRGDGPAGHPRRAGPPSA